MEGVEDESIASLRLCKSGLLLSSMEAASPTGSEPGSPSSKGPTALVSPQSRGSVLAGEGRHCRHPPLPPFLLLTSPAHYLTRSPPQVITVDRVKQLVRDDVEIKSISTDACFAVAKATELMLEGLAERAAAHAAAAGRQHSLEYADVAAVVTESEALHEFLADIVPQTVKAAALLPAMS